jgi:phospholipase C
VVRRWLGQRRGQYRWSRLDERQRPDLLDPHVSASDGKTFPFCPDSSFQFHHQPFNYFSRYAPGTADRATHLQDEVAFLARRRTGRPPGQLREAARQRERASGYSSEPNGSDHLVDLIQAIETGPQAGNTLIVVTYDEFGGQWDHVSPPGLGTDGAHDLFGPGTRVPALFIGRNFTQSGVDHTVYDTTSILATIEHQWPAVGDGTDAQHGHAGITPRDSLVNDSATLDRGGH